MPKKFIYNRVSTDAQDYAQQMECIQKYLEREGIDMKSITGIVTEKISGGVDPGDRKLNELLEACDPGAIIYVSEQSRLCRSLKNSLEFMERCGERGVSVVCCKDNKRIDPNSIEFVLLSWLAEQERKRISFNTRMALEAQKRQIAENGGWVAKRSGKWRTRHGSPKGKDAYNHDMSKAVEVWSKQTEERRLESVSYKWVADRIADGWSNCRIIREFNKLHELTPQTFCAPKGGAMTYPCIARWRKYILEEK